MDEQDILNQIVKHYKAFAEDRIKAIKRCLDREDGTTNVYWAKEAAEELVYGLDEAGEFLIYPERFAIKHIKDCVWCNPPEKGDMSDNKH